MLWVEKRLRFSSMSPPTRLKADLVVILASFPAVNCRVGFVPVKVSDSPAVLLGRPMLFPALRSILVPVSDPLVAVCKISAALVRLIVVAVTGPARLIVLPVKAKLKLLAVAVFNTIGLLLNGSAVTLTTELVGLPVKENP